MPNPLVYDESDFASAPGGIPDLEQLYQEIDSANLSSTPVTLTRITSQNGGVTITVQVHFSGVPDATDEAVVNQVVTDHTATGAEVVLGALSYTRARSKTADSGTTGAINLDCNIGNEHRAVLTGNLTSITIINKPPAGMSQTLRIVFVQAAGTYTVPTSWTGVDWWIPTAGGPVMPATSGKDLIVTIYMNGNESIGTWVAEP